MTAPGLLIVCSGPSGAGKGTICNLIRKEFPNIYYSISATTRRPRNGEKNGVDYFFIDKEEFIRLRKKNGFLEWALVYDNFYGTPREVIEKKIKDGEDVILEIDIQGALQIKKHYPQGVFVFILPPSICELKKRIEARGENAPEDIEKRLNCVHKEIAYISEYDYIITNDKLENAVEKLKAIIIAEKCRPQRKSLDFDN